MKTEIIDGVTVNCADINSHVPASTYQEYCSNMAGAKVIAVPLAKAFGAEWTVEMLITTTYRDFHLVGEGFVIGGTPADRGCSPNRYEFFAVIPGFDSYDYTHGRISVDTRRQPGRLVADIRRRLLPGALQEMTKASARVAAQELRHARCVGVAKVVADLIGQSAGREIERIQQPGSWSTTPTFHYYTPNHGKLEISVNTEGKIIITTSALDMETGLSIIEQLKGE